MFCQHCNMKWQSPATVRDRESNELIPVCPKCNRQMWDTHYTQFLERKSTKTWDIDAACKIFCVETGAYLDVPPPKYFTAEKQAHDRAAWERQKQQEEYEEDKWLEERIK